MNNKYTAYMSDLILEWIGKNNNPIYNKIAGIVYGCAIADCLGVQVEGKKLMR